MIDHILQPTQARHETPGGAVQEVDGVIPIPPPRRDPVPLGVHGHGIELALVAIAHRQAPGAQELAAGGVPQAQGLVMGGAGDPAPPGIGGDTIDLGRVAAILQTEDWFSGGDPRPTGAGR